MCIQVIDLDELYFKLFLDQRKRETKGKLKTQTLTFMLRC